MFLFPSILLLLYVSYLPIAHGVFYLPGVSPTTYYPGDDIKLFVNRLTSVKTQIPYDYFTLPFCTPPNVKRESENLGQILSGDKIEKDSLYELSFKKPSACNVVCNRKVSKEDKDKFKKSIDEDYRVHWIVDNLPCSTVLVSDADPNDKYYIRGFPVGGVLDGKHYVFNHIRLVISYNEKSDGVAEGFSATDSLPATTNNLGKNANSGARIVGFSVEPFSIKHDYGGETFNKDSSTLTTCNDRHLPEANDNNIMFLEDDTEEIIFTYDIAWVEDKDTLWAHRWDVYLRAHPDDKIHWFTITNSTMIVLFLAGMVALILVRALHKDISRYNDELSNSEEARDEYGWKLVHGNVFRAPTYYPMLYSVLVGTGFQLLVMTFATLILALFGFLSPANRGSLTTAFVLLFMFTGSFAGYHSARTYKMFQGTDLRTNALFTAFLYPSFAFTLFIIIDIAMSTKGSTLTLPIGTFFLLLFLWFGISTPLVFLGSYMGYKKPKWEHPLKVNMIAREIPDQPWYTNPWLVIPFAGILPFGAMSMELHFIMTALWLHQFYYIFGFLFLATLILVATCAEITIVMTYFQLCSEDYRWWWRSFLCSGSCAFYLFIYSILYFKQELDISGSVSYLFYFGYNFLFAVTLFLITGCIGYFSAFWFITKIYGAIKVD